jgi:hypothetical protein
VVIVLSPPHIFRIEVENVFDLQSRDPGR